MNEKVNPWAVCVPPNTIILGDNKTIDQYSLGNGIITQNGMQTCLNSFVRQHSGNVVKVKAENILPFIITEEHPLLVATSISKRGKIKSFSQPYWKEVKDLQIKENSKDGDYLLIPRLKGQTDLKEVSLVGFVKNNKGGTLTLHPNISFPVNKDTAWLLGLFVAEGTAYRNEISIYLNDNEVELQQKAFSIIKEIGYSARIRKTRTATKVAFSSHILVRAFRFWCGTKAPNKMMPEFILLHKDLDLVRSFLDGYFAGDGCKTSPTCVSVSKTLIMQVQLAFARLGIISGIWENNRPSSCIIENRVVNQRNTFTLRHCSIINGQKMKTQKNKLITDDFIFLPLRKKESISYDGLVCNVETSDNTYLVNNVVVHNCHSSTGPEKDDKFERCVKQVKNKQGMKQEALSRQELEEVILSTLQQEGILDRIMARVSGNQSALKAMGSNIANVFGAITRGETGQLRDPRLVKAAATAAKRLERHRTALISVLSELSKDLQFLFGEKLKNAPQEVQQQLQTLDDKTADFMFSVQDLIKTTEAIVEKPSADLQINKVPDAAQAQKVRQASKTNRRGEGPTQFENQGMGYEDAMEAVVSRQEAAREIARHHLEWSDFVREVGDKPEYKGWEVLNWLGY